MRKDFNRVLTTDPRRGHDLKFTEVRRSKNNAFFDEEAVGGKEAMKDMRRCTFQRRKTFGDHIAPLHRYVIKQLGRSWDDVYSEISELFDQRSQAMYHVHQHVLQDFVNFDVRMIDGELKQLARWSGWRDIGTANSRRAATIYVHPETGILCWNYVENEAGHAAAVKEGRQLERDQLFREHNADTHLYFIDGVWMVHKLKDIPPLKLDYVYVENADVPHWKFDSLPFAEKALIGKAVLTRPHYKKVDAPSIFRINWRKYTDACPADRYYAARFTAGKKILRAHGLLGTNTRFGKKLLHRQRSTGKCVHPGWR